MRFFEFPMMNFDRVAPYFKRLEKIVFNNQMQGCRTAQLGILPSVKKAALIGEGDGEFLIEFLKHSDCEQVHYIDSSQKMLDLAQKRLRESSLHALDRVEFYHRDLILEAMPDQGYDLIVTNYFLDVFTQQALNECVSKIAASCKESALWLYADFQISGGRLQQFRAILWIKVMYLFFRLVAQIQAQTLIDPATILERHGFKLVAKKEYGRGLMRSELRRRDERLTM